MKIGIMSDSHDRIDNLNKALDIFKNEKAEEIIHCGDFCAPFMVKEMAKFSGKVHCVFGNTDDRYTSTLLAMETGIDLQGDYAELEIAGKKIAVTHFPALAEGLALSGKYNIVFHGHDHKKRSEKRGETLLVNPGELAGLKLSPSVAIYDTDKNDIKHIDLK